MTNSWLVSNKTTALATAAAVVAVLFALKQRTKRVFRIGTPGKPWGAEERAAWLKDVGTVQRSYKEDILDKIDVLREAFDVEQYGALSYNKARYPLFVVKSRNWARAKPTVLVTGGVHGYETSGVQGALLFLQTKAQHYAEQGLNVVVVPCVSPWGYETIQRWNPSAEDPNRGFYPGSSREECAFLMSLLESFGDIFALHLDLHETTDTDSSEFSPALASRDGVVYVEEAIPDGFFIVGNSKNKQPKWHAAMINGVREVTHIATGDKNKAIYDEPLVQEGVIEIPAKKLKICAGVTNAIFAATTEVYPDSPGVTADECNRAQCTAVTAALDYLLQEEEEVYGRRAREASVNPTPPVPS